MKFHDQDFSGQEVTLDGNVFTGCTFQDCKIIYRGSGPVQLSANSFKEGVTWHFDGAASNTIAFLTALYAGGARELVEATFYNIRTGRLPGG